MSDIQKQQVFKENDVKEPAQLESDYEKHRKEILAISESDAGKLREQVFNNTPVNARNSLEYKLIEKYKRQKDEGLLA